MFAKDKVSQSLIDAVNKVLETKKEQLDEATFPDYAAMRKKKEGPQPSGGAGIKQGRAYGGGRQADEPEEDEDEKKPAKRAKYGARQKRFTDTKLYKEADDCVTKPQATGIAKKEIKHHEKEKHGEKGEVKKHEKEMHKEGMTFKDRLIESMYGKKSAAPMDEDEGKMTAAQQKKKEKIVMGMKDKEADFKKKYGKRWKEVMYATATKMAMNEDFELEEDIEQLDEKLEPETKTTDTLAGRIKGGKDNQHMSYKVKLEGDVEESGLRKKAHASAAAGKKTFEFQGKTLPVTVKKEEVEEMDEAAKKKPYDRDEVAKKVGAAMRKSYDLVQKGRAERETARAIANAKYGKMKKEEVEIQEKNESHTHAAHYENDKGEWTGMNLLVAKDDDDAIKQAHAKCKEGCRLSRVERHIPVKEEVELDEGHVHGLKGHEEVDRITNPSTGNVTHTLNKEVGSSGKYNIFQHKVSMSYSGGVHKQLHRGSKEDMESKFAEIKKPKKEEVEQIDELKKSTLASYLKKAHSSTADAGVSLGYKAGRREGGSEHADTLRKRTAGVAKATDKLAKEEVEEIEEMKNTPKDKPAYKLKSFSSMKKEMIGKAGMTSEEINEEE